jgi:hypothetical protein
VPFGVAILQNLATLLEAFHEAENLGQWLKRKAHRRTSDCAELVPCQKNELAIL